MLGDRLMVLQLLLLLLLGKHLESTRKYTVGKISKPFTHLMPCFRACTCAKISPACCSLST